MEWREVRKRRVGQPFSERISVRHQRYPNPRNTSLSSRRTFNGTDGGRFGRQSTGGEWNGRDKAITTFFVNNLPDGCSADFLRRKFATVLEPTEVVCPKKRDLRGKAFGFVRFEGVSFPDKLLADLNTLWIGSYKIRVYKPRFERELRAERREDLKLEGVADKGQEKVRVLERADRKAGISFKDILTGNEGKETRAEEVLHFKPTEEEKAWILGAVTGLLKNEFLWEEVKDEIIGECSGKLKVSTLGGNLVLFQSACGDPTEEILKEMDEWFQFWFLWSRKWKIGDVSHQRVVWTKWVGVPLHAWNPRFFNDACASFGAVRKIHEGTATNEKFDEAFIQVATGLYSCDRILDCVIEGTCFKIRVEEVRDAPNLCAGCKAEEERTKSDSDWSWKEDSTGPADAIIEDNDKQSYNSGGVSLSQGTVSSLPPSREGGRTEALISNDENAAEVVSCGKNVPKGNVGGNVR
ncbi:uncharacterized protein LOC131021120 [Salvia miltiorrhiza]|uniref:uncharacterized protein LOC131021120 n=1 Tax=Salvia miltiorrhiza TaxID=226208 RepID=UPI0025AC0103|nr:uncharacterized protein LOC131021120 [Salvia miltiorrhiza]